MGHLAEISSTAPNTRSPINHEKPCWCANVCIMCACYAFVNTNFLNKYARTGVVAILHNYMFFLVFQFLHILFLISSIIPPKIFHQHPLTNCSSSPNCYYHLKTLPLLCHLVYLSFLDLCFLKDFFSR